MKISHGTTRIAILIFGYAFKIPVLAEWRLFLLGLLANMQENKFSKTKWPKLCPVLLSIPGGFLTVMKRASPMSREEWDSFDVEKWLDCEDYVIPAEPKMDSFGYVNGKLVAIDYGN